SLWMILLAWCALWSVFPTFISKNPAGSAHHAAKEQVGCIELFTVLNMVRAAARISICWIIWQTTYKDVPFVRWVMLLRCRFVRCCSIFGKSLFTTSSIKNVWCRYLIFI